MANSNKLKKHHFLYKTINLLNNTYYIGIHSTNNLNDGYLGSGKRLKRSVNKYGKENFKLIILEFFDSRESLFEKEKELVNEIPLKDPKCMNLKPGGTGGLINDEHGKKFRESGNKKHNTLLKSDSEYYNSFVTKISKTQKERHTTDLYENAISKLKKFWIGRSHTNETKQKMSESKKGKGISENNSQYGTMWITNGLQNKKIKTIETIPFGWEKGRFLNTK